MFTPRTRLCTDTQTDIDQGVNTLLRTISKHSQHTESTVRAQPRRALRAHKEHTESTQRAQSKIRAHWEQPRRALRAHKEHTIKEHTQSNLRPNSEHSPYEAYLSLQNAILLFTISSCSVSFQWECAGSEDLNIFNICINYPRVNSAHLPHQKRLTVEIGHISVQPDDKDICMRLFQSLESQPNKKYERIFYIILFHVFSPFMVFGIVLPGLIWYSISMGTCEVFSSNLFVLFPDIFNLLFLPGSQITIDRVLPK